MVVHMITKKEDFESQVLAKDGQLKVIDFFATWCGPCKVLAPELHRLSELYGQKATFFQVDVDEQPEVASANKVRSMPTIICFRDGVNLGQISTSSHRDVDAMIKKCMA